MLINELNNNNNTSTNYLNDFDNIDLNNVIPGSKKKITNVTLNRDVSPLGGYLRLGRLTQPESRPLSSVELEEEIDTLLEDLTTNCMNADNFLNSTIHRRSRSKQRSTRPMSMASNFSQNNEPGLPELNSFVKICKPRRFGLKPYRKFHIQLKDTELIISKSKDEHGQHMNNSEIIYIPGCEIQSDLCVTSEKYVIRLFVPINRTNLPLASAIGLTEQTNDLHPNEDDLSIGGKLRRKASLLSLTSLSHMSQAFGLMPNGPIGTSGTGNLTGLSASMIGLMNEILLKFTDLNTYMDWLAVFRILTAVDILVPPSLHMDDLVDGELTKRYSTIRHAPPALLTCSTYNAERKAIFNLIKLLSPDRFKADETDNIPANLNKDIENKIISVTQLTNHLDKRLLDVLPLRFRSLKRLHKTWDHKRDYTDHTLSRKTTTLSEADKPPISGLHQINMNVFQRIKSTHAHVNTLTNIQAKLKYISAWEQLPWHGVAFFPAHIEVQIPLGNLLGPEYSNKSDAYLMGGGIGWIPGVNRPTTSFNITMSLSRRPETVGIGPNRIYRCEMNTGEIIASWRLSSIESWHINWELSELILMLNQHHNRSKSDANQDKSFSPIREPEMEHTGRVIIRPINVSVRAIAECLGGYAFLNMRSPEKNQCLIEDTFYKLTTGMVLTNY